MNMGVVQTAYANGSSTTYMEDTMKVSRHTLHRHDSACTQLKEFSAVDWSEVHENRSEAPSSRSSGV